MKFPLLINVKMSTNVGIFIFISIEIFILSLNGQENNSRRLFCFGSLVILDVACCYLWLVLLYINIKNR